MRGAVVVRMCMRLIYSCFVVVNGGLRRNLRLISKKV